MTTKKYQFNLRDKEIPTFEARLKGIDGDYESDKLRYLALNPQKLSDSKELAVIPASEKDLDDPSREGFDCLVLCRTERKHLCEVDIQGIKNEVKRKLCFKSIFGRINDKGDEVPFCFWMVFEQGHHDDVDYPYPTCVNPKPAVKVPKDGIIRNIQFCEKCRDKTRMDVNANIRKSQEQAQIKKIDRMDRSDDGRPSDYRSVDWYPKR